MEAILAGVVFLLALAAAIPWALWAKYCADLRPLAAALADMAIITIGLIGTIIAVENHQLAPFGILGGGLGTFIAISHQKRKKAKAEDILPST